MSGRVTDGQAFAPVANASVTAYVHVDGSLQVISDTVTTDAAGNVYVAGVERYPEKAFVAGADIGIVTVDSTLFGPASMP